VATGVRPPLPPLAGGVAVGWTVPVGVGVEEGVVCDFDALLPDVVVAGVTLFVLPAKVAAASTPKPAIAATDPTEAPTVSRLSRTSPRSRFPGEVGCCCVMTPCSASEPCETVTCARIEGRRDAVNREL
jgi:hypothetical protein